MTFKLYNVPSGGSALWTEAQSSVSVTSGVFDVELGSVTALSLPFDTQYWLGITVAGDAEMTPRRRLMSSPYALYADTAAFLAGSAQASGAFTVAETATLSGKVGIGTSNPGAKLDVAGNVRVRDTFTVQDTALTVKESGNVGIGKLNPATALDVSGTVTATAFVSTSGNMTLGTSNPIGLFNVTATNQTGTFVISSDSAYVGIGVTNPTALLEIICPVNFTSIKSAGYQLGCMQTDEEGTDSWFNATNTCFVKYGGRLPTAAEWYVSMNNYSLLNKLDDREWLSDFGMDRQTFTVATTQTNSLDYIFADATATPRTALFSFRCWISK
ncbi:MAG: hypothetical protein A3G34_07965 [Candidatus Lindowbacteria bacterium RIFCSPLOWO2_12_FULL_62_27]|nr:MAG: hypothetical protein A3G34_07965 [Candidatus Lindowbacteria bacterium RIFCSPLOWO2_12_FULL_62_27]